MIKFKDKDGIKTVFISDEVKGGRIIWLDKRNLRAK